MSTVTEDQIRSIIRDVLGRLPAESLGGQAAAGATGGGGSYRPQQIHRTSAIPTIDTGLGVFETMDEAIRAAHVAWPQFRHLTMEKRKEIIAAIRAATIEGAPKWAAATVEETGMGRVDYKIAKHHIIAKLTPGPEIIEPRVFTGDRGLTLIDYAPFGVIGAITPSTHPVPTLVCNAIGFLSGGNTAAFNPHPASKAVFADAVQTFNRVIQAHANSSPIRSCACSSSRAGRQSSAKRSRLPNAPSAPGPAIPPSSWTRPRTSNSPLATSPLARVSTTTCSAPPKRRSSSSRKSSTR
jgi:hypothetical protein